MAVLALADNCAACAETAVANKIAGIATLRITFNEFFLHRRGHGSQHRTCSMIILPVRGAGKR
jgi:hypothetical protein